MNIIFLDFDGVLNTMGGFLMEEGAEDKFKNQREQRKECKNFLYEFFKDTPIETGLWSIYDLDIDLVTKLNTLVEESDVYFVISSACRIGRSVDEEKVKSWIENKNKDYDEEHAEYKKCKECRKYEEDDWDEENELFRYSDQCEKADIKTDRNGEYCENDLSGKCAFDNSYFWYKEIKEVE